jgi:hypothetical protein
LFSPDGDMCACAIEAVVAEFVLLLEAVRDSDAHLGSGCADLTAPADCARRCLQYMCVCVCVCMYICVYICVYMYVLMLIGETLRRPDRACWLRGPCGQFMYAYVCV